MQSIHDLVFFSLVPIGIVEPKLLPQVGFACPLLSQDFFPVVGRFALEAPSIGLSSLLLQLP